MKLSVTATPLEVPASIPVLLRGNLETSFRLAADMGYQGIELFLRQPDDVNADTVSSLAAGYSLAIPSLGTGMATRQDGLTFTDPAPERRTLAVERFVQFVPLAARLGAALTVGMLWGVLGENGDQRAVRRQQAIDSLRACCEQAGQAGVTVLLEPLHRYQTDWVNRVSDALEIIDELAMPHVGLLADTFHMNIEEVSIEASLQQAMPRLGLVHLADSNKQAPGRGHLDLSSILQTLHEAGYDGFISFEVLPLPTPEDAARGAFSTVGAVLQTSPRESGRRE